MLNGSQIVALACEAAHSPGKTSQGQQFLNEILSNVARIYDVAEARDVFKFNFNPGLSPPALFGSGPYPLPLDYLRVSGSSGSTGAQRSYKWYLNGVPYDMVPVDLAEFDDYVQQAGLNSYPTYWATDMGDLADDRIIAAITVNLVSGSTAFTLPNTDNAGSSLPIGRIATGQGAAGQGISPGSTITRSGTSITLSLAATETITNASVMIGTPPNGYTYPPPSSALPVQIRYQKLMPPMVDFSRIPWFPQQDYLVKKLTGLLCLLNDDSRATQLLGGPDMPGSPDSDLKRWLEMKDAGTDRTPTVQLDRRRFGTQFTRLPNTKTIGFGS